MSQTCASSNHGSWKHITVPTTMTYAASTMQCKRCGVSQCRIVSHRVLLSVAATVAELMFPVSRCVRNTRDCCIVGFCATNGCGSCAAGFCCSAGSGSGTSTGTSLSVGIDFSESKMLLMPSSLASIALSEDQWRPLRGSSLNDGAVLGQCAQTGTGLSFILREADTFVRFSVGIIVMCCCGVLSTVLPMIRIPQLDSLVLLSLERFSTVVGCWSVPNVTITYASMLKGLAVKARLCLDIESRCLVATMLMPSEVWKVCGFATRRRHLRIVSECGDLARAKPHQHHQSETQLLSEMRSADRMV